MGGGSIKEWEESREVKLKSEGKINKFNNKLVCTIHNNSNKHIKSYEIYYF